MLGVPGEITLTKANATEGDAITAFGSKKVPVTFAKPVENRVTGTVAPTG